MSDELDRMCCGETEYCKDCTLFHTLSNGVGGEVKTFTRNRMGRCDFYSGPDKQVIEIRAK